MGTSAQHSVIASNAAPALVDGVQGRSVRGQSLFALALRELVRTPGAVVGLVLVGAIVLAAVLAPVVAPYDPIATVHDGIGDGPVCSALVRHRRPRPRHVQPRHLRCANLTLAGLDLGLDRLPLRTPLRHHRGLLTVAGSIR